MGAGMNNLPPPAFVSDADGLNPNLILADMVSAFEQAAGRILQPAQVERLLINLYAYRESLVRNAIQYTGQQNLLAFASFPMIDYLGQLVGVTRLAAQPAGTTLQFTLSGVLAADYTITAGTQVGSTGGAVLFATGSDLVIAAGQISNSVAALALTPGAAGNGYLPGQINVLMSPNALISAAVNTSTSANGSDAETDDHLRARIQAAPNQFSVAGPADSYRYFALTADPSIADAQVASPAPGQVTVYLLTGPVTTQPAPAPNSAGIPNAALLSSVQAALSADEVRPLTDTVSVSAVTEVDYQISGNVTLFSDADPVATMTAVNAAAQNYALTVAARIQRDIVPSQIVGALSLPGVYEVALTSPAYIQLEPGQWANCTSIQLGQLTGTEHS